MTEPLVTVAGSGNWMLAHDRVGPEVLRRLEGRHGPEVELCDVGSHGLGLLDHLRGQPLLLVVDAAIGGAAPGEVRVVDPDPDYRPGRECSVHQVGPLEALAVARRLFPERMPGRVRLVLVETGAGLGEEAEEEACQRALAAVDQEIADFMKTHEGAFSTDPNRR